MAEAAPRGHPAAARPHGLTRDGRRAWVELDPRRRTLRGGRGWLRRPWPELSSAEEPAPAPDLRLWAGPLAAVPTARRSPASTSRPPGWHQATPLAGARAVAPVPHCGSKTRCRTYSRGVAASPGLPQQLRRQRERHQSLCEMPVASHMRPRVPMHKPAVRTGAVQQAVRGLLRAPGASRTSTRRHGSCGHA